jgi:hypothetical protein
LTYNLRIVQINLRAWFLYPEVKRKTFWRVSEGMFLRKLSLGNEYEASLETGLLKRISAVAHGRKCRSR